MPQMRLHDLPHRVGLLQSEMPEEFTQAETSQTVIQLTITTVVCLVCAAILALVVAALREPHD